MALLLRRTLLTVLLLRFSASASPAGDGRFDPSRVVHVSWRPRAYLYKGFLSEAECDHLVALATGRLENSMVVDHESGKSVTSKARTSSGMFLAKKQDNVVARIEDRIATWTFLPPENGEPMQILRYRNGDKYGAHFDYIRGKNYQALGGHRIASVLMYLSNVKIGGETIFPNSEATPSQPKDDTWSECAKSGYAVKPVKGDALLFFSLHPNATTDPASLHGSCPVVEGEKWSATKWIHVRSFDGPQKRRTPAAECEDEEDLCHKWAAVGECVKNPVYMVGTRDSPGFCRKSCDACTM
ncbi:probable prolyl 4-hydroxylase 6 [Phragmites australis]|uniref:probable prolyl 4-hydroxylase 6 n=1 Tax=Phragmites australis TaxID=29695 RepID=UPI002D779978|nr:probable prolyl 4-hydroxylase 6 [Phragmites australis]